MHNFRSDLRLFKVLDPKQVEAVLLCFPLSKRFIKLVLDIGMIRLWPGAENISSQ